MKSKILQTLCGALTGAIIMLSVFLPLYLCKSPDNEVAESPEYIYLGEYPQSLAKNTIVFGDEPEDDGYFLGSDGERYARLQTTEPHGTLVDQVYKYFKVEKIRWRVLSKADGYATVVCDSIIDNVAFQPYYTRSAPNNNYVALNDSNIDEGYKAYLQEEMGLVDQDMIYQDKIYMNNYKYSYIRYFLNKVFYKNTFSQDEQAKIVETHIDNSAESTLKYDNPFFSEDTDDLVFLLSSAEAVSKNLGFKATYEYDDNRAFPVSAYAATLNAEKIDWEKINYQLKSLNFAGASNLYKFFGTGRALLRSASFPNRNNISTLYCGTVVNSCTAYAPQGIAPAMRVKL